MRRRAIRRRRATAVGGIFVISGAALAGVRLLETDSPAATPVGKVAPGVGARGVIEHLPAATAFQSLAYASSPARASVRVPILMYHRVAPASTATNAVSRDLTVEPEVFTGQMAWLAENGFHPITQRALFESLERGAALPTKPVVLTFDDGYVDAVTTVLPILKSHHFPATFYVITGRNSQPAFLSWAQMKRLDAAGMDVGSHTVGHVELPGQSADGKRFQLERSKRDLEKHLGHPVYWFCYPAGRFDASACGASLARDHRRARATRRARGDRARRHLLSDSMNAPRTAPRVDVGRAPWSRNARSWASLRCGRDRSARPDGAPRAS